MDAATRAAVEAWADASIVDAAELDGGEVGSVHRVDLGDDRRVVAKTAEADLRIEARMLRHLAEHGLAVPAVHHAAEDLLVIAYVDGESRITPAVERDLADRLAALHANSAPTFGFPFDTLTGELDLPNPREADWSTFFGEHRLGYMADRAEKEGLLPANGAERVDALVDDLPALLDHDPEPSLIHGDVWRANLLTDGESVRTFLDPACYYADPEVELAYVDWTDTGGEAFFERYRARAGIPHGAASRRPVYRLLPLLVHLRHFGSEYLDPVRETLAELGY
ncbi:MULTISPECIES: fructosamine kinase family protein [Halolamina]|uniref:Fructosamine-3-kinase n=1 Tax=Halolamina pelagica TaxID=699431 RepID=A0A1I5PVL7_9EURY|nr:MULTISPECIES: fructosamine kinase family protein [Halolamina]NHX34971.1 fructosamine kinase family protein [Halolamina sp. R1-12]SFP38133.1 Fructosamine-3-kinase [Halolamina pelagica]